MSRCVIILAQRDARAAAVLHGFTDLVGACADDADRDDLRAASGLPSSSASRLRATISASSGATCKTAITAMRWRAGSRHDRLPVLRVS
jgi:hypothetical protein